MFNRLTLYIKFRPFCNSPINYRPFYAEVLKVLELKHILYLNFFSLFQECTVAQCVLRHPHASLKQISHEHVWSFLNSCPITYTDKWQRKGKTNILCFSKLPWATRTALHRSYNALELYWKKWTPFHWKDILSLLFWWWLWRVLAHIEPLCPVDEDVVILPAPASIRIEMFPTV